MRKFLLLLLLCLFARVGHTQSDSSKLSQSGPIYYSPPGFFRSGKFSINGKQQTFREVSIRLANARVSAVEFKQYEKNKSLAWYMFGAAMASLTASAIASGNSNTINRPGTIFLGIGCAFIVPEAIFARKRNRHYSRAFQLYNQQFKR